MEEKGERRWDEERERVSGGARFPIKRTICHGVSRPRKARREGRKEQGEGEEKMEEKKRRSRRRRRAQGLTSTHPTIFFALRIRSMIFT